MVSLILSMPSTTFQFSRIAVSALLVANAGCVTDDSLPIQQPPLPQLVAKTLALCERDRENNAEALELLAQAQARLGDVAGARKTLGTYSDSSDFRLTVAHLHCAQIE